MLLREQAILRALRILNSLSLSLSLSSNDHGVHSVIKRKSGEGESERRLTLKSREATSSSRGHPLH